jgi:hypothetical protein
VIVSKIQHSWLSHARKKKMFFDEIEAMFNDNLVDMGLELGVQLPIRISKKRHAISNKQDAKSRIILA